MTVANRSPHVMQGYANKQVSRHKLFSERELTFTFAICYRLAVRLFVCLSVVCNVRAHYSAG